MGTENFGRDVLSRFLYGTRVSMFVGLGAVASACSSARCSGCCAGLRAGSIWDTLIMRGMDVVLAFPLLVLVPVLAGILQARTIQLGPIGLNSIAVVGLAIGVVSSPVFARVARASVLAEAREDYIMAARSFGARTRDLLFGNLLPNIQAPLIVQAAFSLAIAIAAEAAVSFLGLGVQPPDSELGQHACRCAAVRHPRAPGGWWHSRRWRSRSRSSRSTCWATRCATRSTHATERPTGEHLTLEPTDPPTSGTLLDVRNLSTIFPTDRGIVHAVDDISFVVQAGEAVGLVGESGSGKSTVLRSLLGLIKPPGRVTAGEVLFRGRDLRTLADAEMRQIRGGQISLIFQDPVNAFNPALTIGDQLRRVLRLHRREDAVGRIRPRDRAHAGQGRRGCRRQTGSATPSISARASCSGS